MAREDVRMAIGQLFDYRRFAPPGARTAVLLPEKPRADLLELLAGAGIESIWPANGIYDSTAPELVE